MEKKKDIEVEAKAVETPAPETKEVAVKDKKNLAVNEKGGFALTTLDDQLTFASRLIELKMISDTFKTPQQVVIAFQYAKALDIPELLAVKNMYVVNGKPSLFAEGPLSLVQRNPAFLKIREYFLDEEQKEICPKNVNLNKKVYAAVTEVWRKGDTEPQVDFFTLDDLKTAKLDVNSIGNKKDVWVKWERIMLRYKARSMALKSKFADMLAGIPIAEYDDSFSPEMPEIKEATPREVAENLNKAYSEEGQAATA